MFCTFLKNRYGFPSVVQLKIENDTGPSNTQTVESKFVTPAAHCRDARLMLRLSAKKMNSFIQAHTYHGLWLLAIQLCTRLKKQLGFQSSAQKKIQTYFEFIYADHCGDCGL